MITQTAPTRMFRSSDAQLFNQFVLQRLASWPQSGARVRRVVSESVVKSMQVMRGEPASCQSFLTVRRVTMVGLGVDGAGVDADGFDHSR